MGFGIKIRMKMHGINSLKGEIVLKLLIEAKLCTKIVVLELIVIGCQAREICKLEGLDEDSRLVVLMKLLEWKVDSIRGKRI